MNFYSASFTFKINFFIVNDAKRLKILLNEIVCLFRIHKTLTMILTSLSEIKKSDKNLIFIIEGY